MEIIRGDHESHFTIIANDVMRDSRLSFRARGIHHFLLSFPTGWRIDSSAIARAGKEGRDAVRAALKELEECGYLIRQREQDERGRWSTRAYIKEIPMSENHFPMPENPTSGNPVVGDSGANRKNEITKNEIQDDSEADSRRVVVDGLVNEWWQNYKDKHDGRVPTGKNAFFALRSTVSAALTAGWSSGEIRQALRECATVPSVSQFDRILTNSGSRRTAGEDRLSRDLDFLSKVALSAVEAPLRELEK
jgi:hypothetical protein